MKEGNMKILNLYAGIGGNRMLWGEEHEVTSVEWNESVAEAYKKFFPNDTIIVADAHEYLKDNFYKYDFIWSSPPCQTHSRTRWCAAKNYYYGGCNKQTNGNIPVYPDMKLWQEIIFLQNHYKGDWVIENVIPYYKPFIPPAFTYGKHLYWSNKTLLLPKINGYRCCSGHESIKDLEKNRCINLSGFKFIGITKRTVLRNMVEPKDAKVIFDAITKGV